MLIIGTTILVGTQMIIIPESLAQWPPLAANALYSGLYQPSFSLNYFPFGSYNNSYPFNNSPGSYPFSSYNSSFPLGSSNPWLLNMYLNSYLSTYLNPYRPSLLGYSLTPSLWSWISGLSLPQQWPPPPLSSRFFFPPSALIGSPVTTLASVQNEEYAVYSALISSLDTLSRAGVILGEVRIRNHTSAYSSGNDAATLNYLARNLDKIAQETILDYQIKNRQEYPLGDDFTLPFSYKLVGDEEPYQVIELSRVGFNRRGDQALVYVGQLYGPAVGSGYYCFLTKVNGVWVYQDGTVAWIS